MNPAPWARIADYSTTRGAPLSCRAIARSSLRGEFVFDLLAQLNQNGLQCARIVADVAQATKRFLAGARAVEYKGCAILPSYPAGLRVASRWIQALRYSWL